VHKTQLAVVDEHEMFRRGAVSVLAEDPCVEIIHESAGGSPSAAADVVVASPLAFREVNPADPVVVCWGSSDRPLTPPDGRRIAIMDRDRLGSEELGAAVRALAAGLCLDHAGNGHSVPNALDRRRRHILQLLSEGVDTRGISTALFYSERTVKGLIRDIEERLGARNRAEAVAKGIRLGLI
jgi:DNA-binding CsgD family transcriptional regulator